MIERRVIRFHGRVQGVGFRYAVERLANAFPEIARQVFNFNEADHVTSTTGSGTPVKSADLDYTLGPRRAIIIR